MARRFHQNSSQALAADKTLSAFAKRPYGGVFLFIPQFWFGFALALISASFLSADHYRPWVNFHAEAIAISGALLGGAVLMLQQGGFYAPRFWLLWVGCAGFGALLQWWVLPGIYAGDIVIAAVFLGALICTIALGSHAARSSETLTLFALGALVIASTLSAFIGILQWLSLTDILGVFGVHTDFGDRAMGNVAQPNQLGTLLLMGLCAQAYLFDQRHFTRTIFAVLVVLSTLTLALTQSRTALLSATFLSVFVFFPGAVRLHIQRRWMCLWLLFFWGLFLITPAISEELLIGGGRNVSLISSSSRDVVWKQVIDAILQHPWMGYGWNRTATAQMASVTSLPGILTFTYAHNVVLDFLAWYGVPAGLGLMGALAYWFCNRWRRINTPLGACAFAALIPFAIHSLLEFPFAYGYFLATAGFLAGVVEASVEAPRMKVRRLIAAPLLAGLAILGSIAAYEYLEVEEDFRVARFANMRIGRTPEGFAYSEIYVLNHMGEMLDASRMRPHPGMPLADIELLKRVAKRFPYGALTYRYVEALALNEQMDAAKQELKVLHGLYGPMYYQAIRVEIAERGGGYPALLQLLEE